MSDLTNKAIADHLNICRMCFKDTYIQSDLASMAINIMANNISEVKNNVRDIERTICSNHVEIRNGREWRPLSVEKLNDEMRITPIPADKIDDHISKCASCAANVAFLITYNADNNITTPINKANIIKCNREMGMCDA